MKKSLLLALGLLAMPAAQAVSFETTLTTADATHTTALQSTEEANVWSYEIDGLSVVVTVLNSTEEDVEFKVVVSRDDEILNEATLTTVWEKQAVVTIGSDDHESLELAITPTR